MRKKSCADTINFEISLRLIGPVVYIYRFSKKKATILLSARSKNELRSDGSSYCSAARRRFEIPAASAGISMRETGRYINAAQPIAAHTDRRIVSLYYHRHYYTTVILGVYLGMQSILYSRMLFRRRAFRVRYNTDSD